MSSNSVERLIPEIVPSNDKHYAYIDSRDLDKSKGDLAEPITVRVFGGSIDGKTIVIESHNRGALISRLRRRLELKKKRALRNRKYSNFKR